MVCIQITLLIVFFVQAIVVKTHTWYPDPQRAAALEERWNNYKAIPYKTDAAIEAVCGTLYPPMCTTTYGRPQDHETESCDRYCCHQGHLTGFCKKSPTIGVKVNNHGADGALKVQPTLEGFLDCDCTDDLTEAKCGPDGSLMGIRCPFDWSACARKCCRQGRSGGHCGGFLRLKCKCD